MACSKPKALKEMGCSTDGPNRVQTERQKRGHSLNPDRLPQRLQMAKRRFFWRPMRSDGAKLLKGVTRRLTGPADLMAPILSRGLRYPPAAQQFGSCSPEACMTSHTWSGRLRIFLRIVRGQPLNPDQPCERAEASKALGCLALLSLVCSSDPL